MTRVTNFGRKRTYIQAGFHDDNDHGQDEEVSQVQDWHSHTPVKGKGKEIAKQDGDEAQSHITSGAEGGGEEPPKKKRKRIRKKKPSVKPASESRVGQGDGEKEGGEDGEGRGDGDENEAGVEAAPGDRKKGKSKKKDLKVKAAKKDRLHKGAQRLTPSELRRQKRIDQRNAETTCFACREKGHAAKDCPSENGKDSSSRGAVGICYRCGSTRHNLARCKKPTDPGNPLPFASCFVCSGKGHLASSCPQNKDKGVYPNGGCCKLCGETTHLAKDCQLRKTGGIDTTTALFGIGKEAGADEDDFHIFKGKTREVERDERREEKAKKMLNVKAGVHSGIVKSFGMITTPTAKPSQVQTKKVVYF